MSQAFIGRALLSLDLSKGLIAPKFQAQMRELQAMGTGAGGGLGGVIGGALSKAFMATGLLAAGLAGAGIGSIKMAADFQQAMTLVHTQAGYSVKDLDALRQPVISLSKEFGISAKQLADGLYRIASSGIPPTQALEALRAATMLAKVGNSDLETTTNAVAAAMKAYGIDGKNAIKVADVLNATVGAGNMRMQDLASSIGLVLPMASRLNIPLEQVGANLATLTQKGMSTAEAVTALNGLLGALAAPGHAAKQALASIGLTADDVRKMLGTQGLAATIAELDRRTHGNIDTLHHLIPNIRALRDELGVTGASAADYANNLAAINASHAKGKDLAAMWVDTQQDFNVQMDKVKETVAAGAIQLGSRLMPSVEKLMPAVSNLANAGFGMLNAALDKAPGIWASLQPHIAEVRAAFVSMLPTIKDLVGVMGKTLAPLVQYISHHSDLLKKIFIAMGITAGIVVGAFAVIGIAAVGLVAGIIWFYEKWKETFNRGLGQIQNFVVGSVKFMRDLWSNVTAVWKQITDAVGHAAQELHDRPIYWITRLLLLGPQLQIALAQKVRATWDKMSGEAMSFGGQLLRNVTQFFQQLPGNVGRWLLETLQRLGRWQVEMVRQAGEAAGGFVNTIRDVITKTDWGALGRGVLGGIVEGIQSALRAVGGIAAGIASQILRAFKDALGISSPSRVMAVQVGRPIAEGILTGFTGADMAGRLASEARSIRSSFDEMTAPGSGGSGGRAGGSSKIEQLLALLHEDLQSIDRQLQADPGAGKSATGATTIRGVLGALAANAEQAARRGQRGEYVGAVP